MKLTREEVCKYIEAQYGAKAESLWMNFPLNVIFRNNSNQKWFAIIMDVKKEKLGLRGEGVIDVLDIKCEPAVVCFLKNEEGFLPAYHMNKEKWITILLDGRKADDRVLALIDASYVMTSEKNTKIRKE